MRSVHAIVEDKEYEVLETLKNGWTWHEFIMMLACKEIAEIIKKKKK